jgi:hypothetical protein
MVVTGVNCAEQRVLFMNAAANAHGFFHPVISKSCEAMGVASQGAIVQSITERKIPCNRVVCFMLNIKNVKSIKNY